MKKLLAICLVLTLAVGMSATAFAAPEGFVSSPSGNAAPKEENFKPADEDCTANLVITPFSEIDRLSPVQQELFNKAYNSILNAADDLTALNDALAKLAKEKNLDPKFLAVADLFDMHLTDCDYHDGHQDFDITLSADTLSHFVALLHMNKNGQWELVEDAKRINNGEHLQFSVEGFSPFAIIVNTDPNAPDTGDNSHVGLYVAIMSVSALAIGGIVFFMVKGKKKNA